MKKALLIAEKPSLLVEIKKVYDKYGHKDTIVFKSFAGHVTGLKEPGDYKEEWKKWDLTQLPMIPDRFGYKPTKEKGKLFKELKDELKKGNYDYVINACDAEREGEAIYRGFLTATGIKITTKRFWNSELTEASILKSLNNLIDEKEPWLMNLTLAARLRGYFDWLVGLNGTRAVSLATNASKPINIGRVMTPTLKFVVDRELELKSFVSKPFWEIEADFGAYKGIYLNQEEGETKFFDKGEAENIKNNVGKDGEVVSVLQKKKIVNPPRLHSLQELQNEASKLYGYSMDETLQIAQKLYESKLLSYPRTDTGFITKAIAEAIDERLAATVVFEELKAEVLSIRQDKARMTRLVSNKKYVDDKKVGGHFGIMPTGTMANLSALSENEKNIYYLVCRRTVGLFMEPMIINNTEIITVSNGLHFKTNGKVLLADGFMKFYKSKMSDVILPEVTKGETHNVQNVQLIEKKTTPPSRYTDELLGKAMENASKFVAAEELKEVMKKTKGIGTPATRGGIVKKLVALKMLERKKNGYYATDYGIAIIKALEGKEITSPELTAVWEEKLGKVEDGEYDAKQFYQEMFDYTRKLTEELKKVSVKGAEKNNSEKRVYEKKVVGTCLICGASLIEGKSGYRCEKYKEPCTMFVPKVHCKAAITISDLKLMLKGQTTKPKKCQSAKGWEGEACFGLDSTGKIKMIFNKKSN